MSWILEIQYTYHIYTYVTGPAKINHVAMIFVATLYKYKTGKQALESTEITQVQLKRYVARPDIHSYL